MGITIHYWGRLPEESAIAAIEQLAREFAQLHRWPVRSVDFDSLTGIVLYPHKECEPLVLAFDDRLEMKSFVKTQFAGADVHISIVALLKQLAPIFESIEVHDEGEYWESEDRGVLEEHLARLKGIIENEIAKYAGSRMGVKNKDGRIIDLQRSGGMTEETKVEERQGRKPFWKRFIN